MNCREFESAWQSRLDGTPPGEGWSRAEAHAAACPACREADLGYRTLESALRAWSRPVVLMPEEAPRLPAPAAAARSAAGFSTPIGIALALAATVALAIGLPLLRPDPEPRRPARGPVELARAPQARPLVDVSQLTLRFADVATRPAAEFGADLLGSVVSAASAPIDRSIADGPGGPTRRASLRRFADVVTSGFRPLANTTRKAVDMLSGGTRS